MRSFNLTSVKNDNEFIIKLSGELVSSTAYNLLRNLPDIRKCKLVILDGSNLTELDGSGLIAISVIFSHASIDGSDCYIRNLSGQPLKLIKYLNLLHLMSKNRFRNKSPIPRWILNTFVGGFR